MVIGHILAFFLYLKEGWCYSLNIKIDDRKRRQQDEMVVWHHQLTGHEFEQAPGDGEGQGSLACCSPWGRKESDTTERLNNNNNILKTGKGSTPVITIKTSKTTFKKYYELPFATLLGVANRLWMQLLCSHCAYGLMVETGNKSMKYKLGWGKERKI